jgi:predicted DNA-binding transcriptional regulator YafY
VRASRLVTLLLLLQTRGRMTADALAAELGVSVRTIYRDVEALHLSGVPLYGEAGRDGGYRLVDGYRTRLTGLTRDEAAALWLMALPGPAGELGLGEAAATATVKVKAALGSDLRLRVDDAQQRLHVDPTGWYAEPVEAGFLGEVADAVWRQRRLHVRYRRWKAPSEVERAVEPLGLVLKGGRWYMVAQAAGGPAPRTYRVSELLDARPTGEHFDRPADFDLARFWRGYLADFEARRHRDRARIRLSPRGVPRLTHLMEPAVGRAMAESAGPPEADGWVTATIPIESIDHAHEQLLRLGAEVEVLAPRELRDRLARTAAEMANRYHRTGGTPRASLRLIRYETDHGQDEQEGAAEGAATDEQGAGGVIVA